MTNPQRVRLLAGTVGAALLLSACGSGASGTTGKDAAAGYDPAAKVTITWWTGQTTDVEKTVEQLAAQYEKDHPNVTIKASTGASTTDDLLTKLSAGFTGNTYPDV